MRSPTRRAKFVAEALATFMLVFLGTGAIIVDGRTGAITHVGVCVVFGLAVLAMIYALGHVSGAHMNPVATLGFWAAGRLPAREVPPYVAAQLIGATGASLLLKTLFPFDITRLGGTYPSGSLTQAFAMEFVITFILFLVVMCLAHDERAEGPLAGVAIGATVTICALVGGPVSGASMNPARTFGPALVSLNFSHHWIYWLAPAAGVLAAVFAHRVIREKKEG